jgi:hypothetical protein
MLYVVLLGLFGALGYVRASRKARERRTRIATHRAFVPRRDRDAWFV